MIHASFVMIASVLLVSGNPLPAPQPGLDISSAVVSVESGATPSAPSSTESAGVPDVALIRTVPAPRRPGALPLMYVTRVALQGYDAYSTFAVLNRGGVEANPLMKGAAHPAVFVAVKAATSALTIAVAERMWRKQGRRKAAVALLAVTNGILAISAAHNASVLRQLR
jgi:hypothetical protein